MIKVELIRSITNVFVMEVSFHKMLAVVLITARVVPSSVFGFFLDLLIIPHCCFDLVFLLGFLPILLMRHGVVTDRVFPSTYLLPGLHQSSE